MTFKEVFDYFEVNLNPHDLVGEISNCADGPSIKGYTRTTDFRTNNKTWYHFKNYKNDLIIDRDCKVLITRTVIRRGGRHARLVTVNFFPLDRTEEYHNLDIAALTNLFFILSKEKYKDLRVKTCILIDYSYLSLGASADYRIFTEAKKLGRLSNIKSIIAAPYNSEVSPLRQALGHLLSELFFNMTLVANPKEASDRTILSLKQILQIN